MSEPADDVVTVVGSRVNDCSFTICLGTRRRSQCLYREKHERKMRAEGDTENENGTIAISQHVHRRDAMEMSISVIIRSLETSTTIAGNIDACRAGREAAQKARSLSNVR